MKTWLLILSPALLFTAAQALLKYGLTLTGVSDAGALTSCLLLPLVLLCFHKFHKASPRWKCSRQDLLLWLAVTIGLAALNLCIPSQPGHITALHLLSSVLCAPISEELIYRGLTFDFAQPLGTPAAVIISFLLFGAAHSSLTACLAAAFLGAALCWMRLRFQSLFLPILTHAVLNLTAMLF